jgi:hypothetical protein
MPEVTIYKDEDPLGFGKFYGYVSFDGHVLTNFGPFDTETEAHDALKATIK